MRRPLVALALCSTLLAGALSAQGVLVAPHVVVIDHLSRGTAITLYNPGAEPAEVSISGFFGYPITDSIGEFELATPDPATAGLPSSAGWIDAYPRRVLVGPLERQTIRLLGRPPANLADGEYWSRLMISAKGGRVAVQSTDSASGIDIGLDLEVRTIIPVQYRKGSIKTGVRIEGIRAEKDGDSLAVRARMVRQGNAAFVGTGHLRLRDESGRLAAEAAIPLAVYVEIDPLMRIATAALPAGRYTLEIELVTERTDLPDTQIVPAAPARASLPIVLE